VKDRKFPTEEPRIPPSSPVFTWKQRAMRGYTPAELSPEEQRDRPEITPWHAQKGLHCAKLALECANSNQEREAALEDIQIFTEMLERNKEN
jgi:hypothetical protein